jgi:beta-lactamase class A
MRHLVAALVLILVGCSGSDRPSPDPATSTTTTTTAPSTTTTEPASSVAARLRSTIDAYVARQPVAFSVVAVDLATGARAGHLEDRRLLSASLYKLFVAAELERRIADGTLDPDGPAGDGSGRTVGACLEAMIVVSDNPCGAAGLRLVGGGQHDPALRAAGYAGTTLASPQQTTAADVALFLQRARDGTLLGDGRAAATKHLYGLLQRQQVNDRLPTGLPAGTPIAHKTGDRRTVAHDAGVITTRRGDIVVVVLSGPWPLPCCDADHPGEPERIAFAAIAGLGRAVYDALSVSSPAV